MHVWVSYPNSQEILYYQTWREVVTSSNLLNPTSVLKRKFREDNCTWIGCKHFFFYFLYNFITYSISVKSMGYS